MDRRWTPPLKHAKNGDLARIEDAIHRRGIRDSAFLHTGVLSRIFGLYEVH